MPHYDIGIIGAGIHGCATAFHLSGRGLRVAIFERDTPASGPTGRSGATCAAYFSNPFLARCARDSIEMLRGFEQLTGKNADWHRMGLLYLHALGDVEAVTASVLALNELGITVDLLEPDQISARFPQLDPTGIGLAAWVPDAGYADPVSVTMGMFSTAVEGGVDRHLRQQVDYIQLEDGGGATLVVGQERVRCARLLVAAGPWTRPLLASAGVELPLTVVRHVVGAFRWGAAERVPALGDLLSGYYMRPEGSELFLAGSDPSPEEVDADASPRAVTDEELFGLASRFVRRVPGLELAEFHSGWSCLYDMSPDQQPVIGEVAPGVYVDAGTSGFGFTIAPALGRHVADLLAGEEVDSGLKEFHPVRFAEGRGLRVRHGGMPGRSNECPR